MFSSNMWRAILFVLLLCPVCGIEVPNQQTKANDGYGGKGTSIPPISTEGKPAVVIVLHGLGGTGQEWATLFLPVSLLSLTYVKFILPTAPMQYVTYLKASMPSWFDIQKLGPDENISKQDLYASVERVNRIVEGEIKSGTPAKRIFIMGFSQGGAVALTAFLRSKHKLAGCMAVATWLPRRFDYPTALSPNIQDRKTLMIHGDKDEVLPFKHSKASFDLLRRWGQPGRFVRIKNGGHKIFTVEILELLEKFIEKEAPGPTKALSDMVNNLTEFFQSLSGSV